MLKGVAGTAVGNDCTCARNAIPSAKALPGEAQFKMSESVGIKTDQV